MQVGWVLAEVLLCSTVTPPNFDYKFTGRMLGGTYTYSFDDMGVVVSLVKCLVLLRLYLHFGKRKSKYVEELCSNNNIDSTALLAFKCELK